jgi:hypothetical protein
MFHLSKTFGLNSTPAIKSQKPDRGLSRYFARKSIIFLADAAALRPLRKRHFSQRCARQVCRKRSFWLTLISSNGTSQVGESWDC